MLSGILQEGKGFPGVLGTSQLLGSCIENNKTFMYLLKIGHYSIVYLVGCGGDAYMCVLCLTVLSVYIA